MTDERIKKGIEITKKAILERNFRELANCLRTFKVLHATPAAIQEALQDCPMDLLEKTGYAIKIQSSVLDRTYVIGKDMSYEELGILLKSGIKKEYIPLIVSAKTELAGKIEGIEPIS